MSNGNVILQKIEFEIRRISKIKLNHYLGYNEITYSRLIFDGEVRRIEIFEEARSCNQKWYVFIYPETILFFYK